MNRCVRTPDCPGHIDETGHCTRCGLRAAQPVGVPDHGSFRVADLVDLPVLSFDGGDPPAPPPEVPEQDRYCGRCHRPVGRAYAGQPARTAGFCRHCDAPYLFVRDLADGEEVDDRYRVDRCLARGGMGWIYLAWDNRLKHEVVLKGVLNRSELTIRLAAEEGHTLIRLDHRNIVRIFNVAGRRRGPEPTDRVDYIVMEHLPGMTLRQLLRAARDPGVPEITLPLEHILGYGHEILAALGYLHAQGLVHSDVKLDNIMRTRDRIKVIDLGVVCEPGTKDPMPGTPHYRVDAVEVLTHGLTARSDLYSAGLALDELYEHRTPSAFPIGDLAAESFRRLIDRAKDRRFSRRFASAEEMSVQLVGVLREVLGRPRGRHQFEPSGLFAASATLLDRGLGQVPPLEVFALGQSIDAPDHGRPTPAEVAIGLPVPQPAPDDEAAAFLTTVEAPNALLAKLAGPVAVSTELLLARCRAYIAVGDPDSASAALAAALGTSALPPTDDWRLAWHRGLLALARGDAGEAEEQFDNTYSLLPGETAPKLALGYCAEALGQPDSALRYYQSVWRTDGLQAGAAFGLARVHLAKGDRAAAVGSLDAVPSVSRHYEAARIAAIRVLIARVRGGLPAEGDVNAAMDRLNELGLQTESRNLMTTAIREVELDMDHGNRSAGLRSAQPAGRNRKGASPAARLESSLRVLAKQAPSEVLHHLLIDRANTVRPKTLR